MVGGRKGPKSREERVEHMSAKANSGEGEVKLTKTSRYEEITWKP